MVAFWGGNVTETKAVVVNVPQGFVLNVCNVTCETCSANDEITLGLETKQIDEKLWKGVVAHVGGKQPVQVKLDLVFGHTVKFYVAKGSGVVNLTGYFQPGPSVDWYIKEEKEACHGELEKTKNAETTGVSQKGKKRARLEKITTERTSWDEMTLSPSDSQNVSEMKEKAVVTTSSTNEEEQKKKEKIGESPAIMSSSSALPTTTLQKKKRKKKHKKQNVHVEAK